MQTLSFHLGGGKAHQAHNIRKDRSTGGNVDPSRSKNNIVLIHQDERKIYKRLFEKSVQEFNAKQKNKDRVIKDYFSQIQKDSKKHTSYELIVQIGGKNDPQKQTGQEVNVYIDYVNNFQKRNPNLIVIGAYIHCDETSDHLHLDYIPIKHSKRGLSIQNSQEGAFNEMGYFTKSKSNTAQIQWEAAERAHLRELCKEYNIALFEQGIGHKRHLSTPEYKTLQDELKALKTQNKALTSEIEALNDHLIQRAKEYDELNDDIQDLKAQNKKLKKENQKLSSTIEHLQNAENFLNFCLANDSRIQDWQQYQQDKTYKNILNRHQQIIDDDLEL